MPYVPGVGWRPGNPSTGQSFVSGGTSGGGSSRPRSSRSSRADEKAGRGKRATKTVPRPRRTPPRSADGMAQELSPPGVAEKIAAAQGFETPATPTDQYLQMLQGMLGQTATPTQSLAQYLSPFDAAQNSLSVAAMQGHAEIERNHKALAAALAARQGVGRENLQAYQGDLGASQAALAGDTRAALAGLGGSPQERAVAGEANSNVAELARLQRDAGSGANAMQQATNLERSQSADDIRASALGSIAANQNQAQMGIATGRANATADYQAQVAAAQASAQGQNLDVLKMIYDAQRNQVSDDRLEATAAETARHNRATEGRSASGGGGRNGELAPNWSQSLDQDNRTAAWGIIQHGDVAGTDNIQDAYQTAMKVLNARSRALQEAGIDPIAVERQIRDYFGVKKETRA